MTRHSTLTNPSDLHYAKVRSFNGSPNTFQPDFIDQLIVATDTNKVYRAFGVNQGEMIELLAGESSLVELGGDYPIAAPLKAGLVFFAIWTSQLYVSITNQYGMTYWKPFQWTSDFFSLECEVNYDDAPNSDNATFSLLYTPIAPNAINSADFEFTEVVQPNIPTSITALDLSFVMRGVGRGVYSVGYTVQNPNNYFLFGALYNSGGTLPSCFTLIDSPNDVSAFGARLSRRYLFYSGDIATEPLKLGFKIQQLTIGG